MKRHGNLYPQITAWDNLALAARKAKKGKRFRPNVARFQANLENNLVELQRELTTFQYAPGPYREMTIHEPKTRMISAAPYRDRVVHHAIINVIEPIWERSFIHDSYACRKEKGTHAALTRMESWLKTHDFVLKCDIRKFFPSIDHEILKSLLRRKIKCRDTLRLLDLVIDHSNPQIEATEYFTGDDLFTPWERRRGIPIGNQTSQFFSNVYMDPFDHFIKDRLRVPCYLRYCDDFLVFGNGKADLWNIKRAMESFLDGLRLRMHPDKSTIIRCEDGFPFLGYRCYPGWRKLDRRRFADYRRKMFRMAERTRSGHMEKEHMLRSWHAWSGHAQWACSRGLKRRFARDIRERLGAG